MTTFYEDMRYWQNVRASMGVPDAESFWQWLASSPEEFKREFFGSLTPKQHVVLMHAWGAWARSKQFPPQDPFEVWFVDAGRAFGKTRTGAETVIGWAREYPKTSIHLIGRTAADVRDIMVDGTGKSSILEVAPPDFRPIYEPSRSRLTFPNGSHALMFSSAQPDDLRGPQCHRMWCDEPAVWLHQQDTWDMAILGMRMGGRFPGDIPQCIVTSTPKSNQLILYLIDQSYDRLESRGELPPHLLEKRIVARNGQPLKVPKMRVVITKGSTYENKSNLPPSFFANLISKYEGTKLGRQELEAELVPDSPGALWRRAWIDDLRVENASPLIRTCIGVDPSGAVGETANACGIIVAGIGEDNHQYILGDASGVMTPAQWGKIVVELFVRTQANAIVAERNFGGLMVEEVIRGAARQMGVFIPPIVLLTASKAKKIRGEPVASLYEGRPGSKERGIVHHVGIFLELEDELCSWDPSKDKKSPNRLDALVWAIHWLNRWHEPQVAIY